MLATVGGEECTVGLFFGFLTNGVMVSHSMNIDSSLPDVFVYGC